MNNRAVQFMPFAALRGYYGMVKEKEDIKEPKIEVSEEDAMILSEKLGSISKGDIVSVKYYDFDCYNTIEGIVTGIDKDFRILTIESTDIFFDDIYKIKNLPEE